MAKSSKGGQFEREVAKYLTKWLSGSVKPVIFWRTPASGAMMTIHGDDNMSGDIISVRPEGNWITDRYSLELKNGYADTSLDKFLKYNKSDPLKAFWEQCVGDAVDACKHPMLIYKKKGMSTIWVGLDYVESIIYKNDLKDIRSVQLKWCKDDNLPDLYLYEMKEFFDILSPDIMKERLGV